MWKFCRSPSACEGFASRSARDDIPITIQFAGQITLSIGEGDKGIRNIVGVNVYAENKPLAVPILKMDPDGYERQVSRLHKVRQTRDNGRTGQKLDRLRIACLGTENAMPRIMECVHAYATLGEIVGVMKGVFGEYQELSVI